ncbi:uncharacterized protein LOC127867332 [Dreissena polymorpha]|uniref:Uncharacterized protein n=1 Tax=Dreissena polymorpha TaxID=45954 RepID=A0A9D4M1B7_DREPO|nr:uncharacterized protein LOC127867332 [Dreissena polymorpha]XP_052264374.1 uncharacterized protein LOC127867332 [Dreissena polymorpha]XP_052264375.1 uncharacterized protein LOC127867332 [Dreissena polymorpha]XP_052264376.1 uncharacterized protein LOC127867332 [Dreissena polymorpha]XP_052264377.1 uncharacterized protein LOC127867332 [Dreissena polymorpha]KAH3866606.1 hypothetical protein DPMN_029703 [Dreissena polymorpha]
MTSPADDFTGVCFEYIHTCQKGLEQFVQMHGPRILSEIFDSVKTKLKRLSCQQNCSFEKFIKGSACTNCIRVFSNEFNAQLRKKKIAKNGSKFHPFTVTEILKWHSNPSQFGKETMANLEIKHCAAILKKIGENSSQFQQLNATIPTLRVKVNRIAHASNVVTHDEMILIATDVHAMLENIITLVPNQYDSSEINDLIRQLKQINRRERYDNLPFGMSPAQIIIPPGFGIGYVFLEKTNAFVGQRTKESVEIRSSERSRSQSMVPGLSNETVNIEPCCKTFEVYTYAHNGTVTVTIITRYNADVTRVMSTTIPNAEQFFFVADCRLPVRKGVFQTILDDQRKPEKTSDHSLLKIIASSSKNTTAKELGMNEFDVFTKANMTEPIVSYNTEPRVLLYDVVQRETYERKLHSGSQQPTCSNDNSSLKIIASSSKNTTAEELGMNKYDVSTKENITEPNVSYNKEPRSEYSNMNSEYVYGISTGRMHNCNPVVKSPTWSNTSTNPFTSTYQSNGSLFINTTSTNPFTSTYQSNGSLFINTCNTTSLFPSCSFGTTSYRPLWWDLPSPIHLIQLFEIPGVFRWFCIIALVIGIVFMLRFVQKKRARPPERRLLFKSPK